ncbi:class I SAM-dependent methyltransferase [Streptomyces sp. RB6PN25]|uniref:Class I SAM-dependent methyltransferase n=1 Tax=Streptomyces humicola TaxID=2953240 RepID=A0ABT1Q1C6_9ACTN|nr:class I SAM-dependent methyltransferase [Streptomyces humicola]MCQ4083712.1 class I SAM-dependent methyltransferase [Streptomyces humicola]
MNAAGSYQQAWEGFWAAAPKEAGAVIWDTAAADASAAHLPLFEPHFDASLPVVDVGCGNGTQTRYLAEVYDRAIGVDLARGAVERARAADTAGAAEYRGLDAADEDAVRRLHDETGDVNVYMRAILHQCEATDRPKVVAGLALLIGDRGRIFDIELATAAKQVLAAAAQGPDGPPPKLRPVLEHGLTPAEMPDGSVAELYRSAGLDVLAHGELPLVMTEHRSDGSRIDLPAHWVVAGRKG